MIHPWLQQPAERLARNAEGRGPAHALLLSGPRGLGKLELAMAEAATLLCLEESRPACGRCRSCRLIAGGAHPDFRRVTFELNDRGQLRTEIVIHQIRELIASLQLTNTLSPRKVALIHPAESMNRNTANALLKTLEEPAGDVVLILVAHDAGRLPATVRSRCQVVDIRLPDTREATDWLRNEHGADPDTAALALEAGAGTPLRAAELLESGRIDDYRAVCDALRRIARDPDAIGDAFSRLVTFEPAEVWTWLSLAAARAIRSGWTGEVKPGPGAARAMLDLQSQADRNHRLTSTPVRNDLLLRDWLLQWAALAGAGAQTGT